MKRREFLQLAGSLLPLGDQVLVVHTQVFAAAENGGNPCPVVPHADRLTTAEMQELARRFGLDTAFIVPPGTGGADLHIRYFVPDHEMGVSGHATIAAITVALLDKTIELNPVIIETSSGRFEADWVRDASGYRVTLAQNPPVFGAVVAPGRVAPALRIHASEIASFESPIQAVSVSRAKLLVPLRDSRVLNRLDPDYEALWRLCEQERVSGLYPFTRHTDQRNIDVEARQFPLRAGFPEDAATGVAAAALGAYLVRYDLRSRAGHHEFRIAQGYAMGAPSLIEATADCAEDGTIARTAIRGLAQILYREQIRL